MTAVFTERLLVDDTGRVYLRNDQRYSVFVTWDAYLKESS
jgi:hypothetical protein